MLKKLRFLAVNSAISGGAVSTSLVCKNGCSVPNIASHCEQEYKTCYNLKITKKNDKI